MVHRLAILSATSTGAPKLDLLRYCYNDYWIKAYVKLFEKTPQTERTPLKTIQVDLRSLDTNDSIVSHSLIGQLNQTLIDRKQTLFPVLSLYGGEQIAKYP